MTTCNQLTTGRTIMHLVFFLKAQWNLFMIELCILIKNFGYRTFNNLKNRMMRSPANSSSPKSNYSPSLLGRNLSFMSQSSQHSFISKAGLQVPFSPMFVLLCLPFTACTHPSLPRSPSFTPLQSERASGNTKHGLCRRIMPEPCKTQ